MYYLRDDLIRIQVQKYIILSFQLKISFRRYIAGTGRLQSFAITIETPDCAIFHVGVSVGVSSICVGVAQKVRIHINILF